MNVVILSIPNEKSEIEICKFDMHCLRSNLSNDYIISA